LPLRENVKKDYNTLVFEITELKKEIDLLNLELENVK